ncbi:MAG: LuxR C-terminal-related transcriptional regulator [Clostridiales bacterium]|jgi:LuxR family maltose regulon positive regulatory protein|nr:LuxR C-terminal-related transcriptional regulator [Clostridiales bacterium]
MELSSLFKNTSAFLPRPRVDALLRHACAQPVVHVAAGPGYGKTLAVASYAQKTSAEVIWLSLSLLDNAPCRFWFRFLDAAAPVLPAPVCTRLKQLNFPDGHVKTASILRLLDKAFCAHSSILLVADNYSRINEPRIKLFFHMLAHAGVNGLCVLLISDNLMEIAPGKPIIGINDLKFTYEETQSLFAQNNLAVPARTARQIHTLTNGWPLAACLSLIYMQSNGAPYTPSAGIEIIERLFDARFFSNYGPAMQKLLVKLSLLGRFTCEIMHKLGGISPGEATAMVYRNIFIHTCNVPGVYAFKNTYGTFLEKRQFMLTDEEIYDAYYEAGNSFYASKQFYDAIDCFAKIKHYDKLLSAIASQTNEPLGLGAGRADYFLTHLNAMPDTFVRANPLADYLKACALWEKLHIEEAQVLLTRLERRLLHTSACLHKTLLGEVYTLMGQIALMQNREDFGEYYRRACAYMPGGGSLRYKNVMLVGNIDVLIMQGNAPGALKRMDDAMHKNMPYIIKAVNSGAHGLQHLFSAEAAYNRYDFTRAKTCAYEAAFKARAHGQHDILCNAHALLARIAMMEGDYTLLHTQVHSVKEHIESNGIVSLDHLKDTVMGWFHLKMGDYEKLAPWLTARPFSNNAQPPIAYGRDRLLFANYLLRLGEHHELLALSRWLEELYTRRGLWLDKLQNYVMRAIACLRLLDTGGALDALYLAYDMSYQNNVVSPFAEGASQMQDLVLIAKGDKNRSFNRSWLDSVFEKAARTNRNQAILRKDYNKQHYPRQHNPLGLRQLDMLSDLALGLTREQIAQKRFVSVNTVKTTIRNIYKKLGAQNRAEAIRLATAQNLLD